MGSTVATGGRPGAVARLLPWVVATGIFGLSFGSIGVSLGVPGPVLVVSSLVIFSPSVQFAVLGLAAADGAVLAVVFTGLLLASRLFVVGIPMSAWLEVRGPRRLALTHLVIDASVIASLPDRGGARGRLRAFIETGLAVYLSWVLGTVAGVALGDGVGDLDRFGLDAALPALFLGLLAPLLTDVRALVALLLGGATAALTIPVLPAGAPVLLGCLAGFGALALPASRPS